MRPHRSPSFALCAAVLALAACQARPVPLSAQAGSTIAIPVASAALGFEGARHVGFGGSEHVDPQRGSFVFQLDGPGGFELDTRFALEVEASLRADVAGFRQIVVVVDIPADAPVGDHALHGIVRRQTPSGVEEHALFPPYQGELTILPHEIEIDLPGGGTRVVTGEPTPSAHFRPAILDAPAGWYPHDVAQAIPHPAFLVAVAPRAAPIPGDTRRVAAAVYDISYPADVIDIHAVVADAPQRDLYWSDDDRAGHLRVNGAAMHDLALDGFWVVFDLDDPGVPLDVADVTVALAKATDQNGSTDIVADHALVAGTSSVR